MSKNSFFGSRKGKSAQKLIGVEVQPGSGSLLHDCGKLCLLCGSQTLLGHSNRDPTSFRSEAKVKASTR